MESNGKYFIHKDDNNLVQGFTAFNLCKIIFTVKQLSIQSYSVIANLNKLALDHNNNLFNSIELLQSNYANILLT
ncbi:unnamed protein product [Rotaria sordida]|uniref:Uncharacterized protein n=1 Tax=Rotaria sordida TaxID=392033 RepID=A0A815DHZ6_9BILA|nr:unnamed protein product [Rotaria sordida]CAF1572444.1 unnamed protein product [Rotaria sordida]